MFAAAIQADDSTSKEANRFLTGRRFEEDSPGKRAAPADSATWRLLYPMKSGRPTRRLFVGCLVALDDSAILAVKLRNALAGGTTPERCTHNTTPKPDTRANAYAFIHNRCIRRCVPDISTIQSRNDPPQHQSVRTSHKLREFTCVECHFPLGCISVEGQSLF